MEDTEIEIKVKIEKSGQLINFLRNNGKLEYKSRQIDKYYVPKHRNFASNRPINEWLRLRNSEGKYSITYKNWKYDKNDRSWHCDEYETAISNLRQMEKIFKVLDFQPLVTVDKRREAWKYKSFEISLDHVKDLGNFVEVEYTGKSKRNVSEIIDDMIIFLKGLNCGKIHREYTGGYAFMKKFPKEVKFEEL